MALTFGLVSLGAGWALGLAKSDDSVRPERAVAGEATTASSTGKTSRADKTVSSTGDSDHDEQEAAPIVDDHASDAEAQASKDAGDEGKESDPEVAEISGIVTRQGSGDLQGGGSDPSLAEQREGTSLSSAPEGAFVVRPVDDVPSVTQAPILDAASSQLSFQALLTNTAGDPLPGPSVELVFNIWDPVGNVVVEGPIGPFVVPINDGVVDTLIPVMARDFDGSERELGVIVNRGAELVPRVSLAAVPYAFRVDRVASEELDDVLELGATDADGRLRVWSNARNLRTIDLNGSIANLQIVGDDGLPSVDLFGRTAGAIQLYDLTDNNMTVLLTATTNAGGILSLSNAAGTNQVYLDGGAGTVNTDGEVNVVNGIGGQKVVSLSQLSAGDQGGRMETRNAAGQFSSIVGSSTTNGGVVQLFQAGGNLGADLDGDANGANGGGDLTLYQSDQTATVFLAGQSGTVEAIDSLNVVDSIGGTARGALTLSSGGAQISLLDELGVQALLGGASSVAGGFLQVYQKDGGLGVEIDGDASGNDGGGDMTLFAADGSSTVFLDGESSAAGLIQVRNNTSGTRVQLDGESTGTGGEISVYDANGTKTVEILGAESSGDGAQIKLFTESGVNTIEIDGDASNAGFISIKDGNGVEKVFLDVTTSNNDTGRILVKDGDGTTTIDLIGQENDLGGGQILLKEGGGATRIELDAVGNDGGKIYLYQDDGNVAIAMDGNSFANGAQGGGRIRVRNADNQTRVYIDGNYLNNGIGRVRADIIRVQGGVDLAEPFVCKDKTAVKPGMVMSIDPDSSGGLMIATQAYDRKVAGIVSGAGGVQPGIMLMQEGVIEGDHPVALTGRVYCRCDASFGAIRPGDLLTTSNTAGYAMKVTDYSRAQGATIGKAMTALSEGKGLVLVLVQPQ